MIPDLAADDLRPAVPGIRAQAVGQDGRLIDDFRTVQAGRLIHVLNAPSPAATASLVLGRQIAEWAAIAAES
jgi:L-2-hydroxyglutarate oxidase